MDRNNVKEERIAKKREWKGMGIGKKTKGNRKGKRKGKERKGKEGKEKKERKRGVPVVEVTVDWTTR